MNTYRIIEGEVVDGLKNIDDGTVQCCVTSPPYWGLRDYGTAEWEGGDESCDHRHQQGGEGSSSAKQNTSAGTQTVAYLDVCKKCGARRVDNQIGLEKTPEEFVARLVGVFREVRRVLRDDGVLFLNLGDSYASNNSTIGRNDQDRHARDSQGYHGDVGAKNQGKSSRTLTGSLKPKDLVGIPWMVAFALRADGWYLRSDIIWEKRNPMPESVTDRPTKSHEYIFLLSKSAKYFWDQDAVREEWADSRCGNPGSPSPKAANIPGQSPHTFGTVEWKSTANGRNIRSVWTISTKPYKGAHFATFPPEIPERCIKAGSKVGDLVLDPFAGSGTTLSMAVRLGRNAVGCELNPDYAVLAHERIEKEAGKMFVTRID